MSSTPKEDAATSRPRVAVLTPLWGGSSEEHWALRQVAGALALTSEDHVLTPRGAEPQRFRDGVMYVFEAGTSSPWQLSARRDLLLSMLRGRPSLSVAERRQLESVLDEGQQHWDALDEPLRALRPKLVVMADHRETGAAQLVRRVCPDVPVLLVPLAGRLAQPEDPYFAPVLELADAAAVFSITEAELVRRGRPGLDVHNVGLPLAADPSLRREAHPFVGDGDYALVLTGAPFEAKSWVNTQSTLLQMGFPRRGVVVDALDRMVIFRHGQKHETFAVERNADLRRLMAWATMTVDLCPGTLYSRWTLESLLYGSPVVVPADSRAREHVELGRAGLWFDGPGDLLWCVEALFDETVNRALAEQGRRYAETHYSGTTAFVKRIDAAVAPLMARSAGAA